MSRSFGATEFTSVPSMRISPSLTVSSPAIMASSVDLPQPDGPTSAMNSPVFASRSIPLRTSTGPKRLMSLDMVSVAMPSPSFDGALGQAADEIFPAEEINEEGRDGGDQNGAARNIIRMGVLLASLQSDKRGRDRLLAATSEHDAERILVPDAGELPDDGDHEDRRRERKNDLVEDAPETGAIDARRLDEVVRNVDVIVTAEERRERNALDHVDEDEAIDRVGERQRAQDEGPWQQRNLARHENTKRHQREQRFRSKKAPFGKDIAVDRAEHCRNDRRRDRHDQRIKEVALNAFAGAGDAVMRPGLRPGLEREAVRQSDQAVARDLGQFAERIAKDDQEREQVDQREEPQEGIDRDSPRRVADAGAAGIGIERGVESRVSHGPPVVNAMPSTLRRGREQGRAPPGSLSPPRRRWRSDRAGT